MTIDSRTSSDPLRRRLRRICRWERRIEALDFLRMYHEELNTENAEFRLRSRQVKREIMRYGEYTHTPAELAFGARVAWRNHARCVGRLMWKSLNVIDCRHITDPDGIAERCFEHARQAAKNGQIRSTITIFAPVRKKQMPAWIENRQVVQYAGYQYPDGKIYGDPLTTEATRTAISLGWQPPMPESRFDVLPLVIRDSSGLRHVYDIPKNCYAEVNISHPSINELSELDLRWYTVPLISGMILSIGGIDYPCAPFNGHYMSTEIANRNFADTRRYNILQEVAHKLGMDTSPHNQLWRDRALTELNEAVIWSFKQEGVTLTDHHTASQQYMDFVQREASSGRTASGDWAWIVPPQATSSCPVYHLPMHDRKLIPNFYYSRATDGRMLRVSHEDKVLSYATNRFLRYRQWLFDKLRER